MTSWSSEVSRDAYRRRIVFIHPGQSSSTTTICCLEWNSRRGSYHKHDPFHTSISLKAAGGGRSRCVGVTVTKWSHKSHLELVLLSHKKPVCPLQIKTWFKWWVGNSSPFSLIIILLNRWKTYPIVIKKGEYFGMKNLLKKGHLNYSLVYLSLRKGQLFEFEFMFKRRAKIDRHCVKNSLSQHIYRSRHSCYGGCSRTN